MSYKLFIAFIFSIFIAFNPTLEASNGASDDDLKPSGGSSTLSTIAGLGKDLIVDPLTGTACWAINNPKSAALKAGTYAGLYLCLECPETATHMGVPVILSILNGWVYLKAGIEGSWQIKPTTMISTLSKVGILGLGVGMAICAPVAAAMEHPTFKSFREAIGPGTCEIETSNKMHVLKECLQSEASSVEQCLRNAGTGDTVDYTHHTGGHISATSVVFTGESDEVSEHCVTVALGQKDAAVSFCFNEESLKEGVMPEVKRASIDDASWGIDPGTTQRAYSLSQETQSGLCVDDITRTAPVELSPEGTLCMYTKASENDDVSKFCFDRNQPFINHVQAATEEEIQGLSCNEDGLCSKLTSNATGTELQVMESHGDDTDMSTFLAKAQPNENYSQASFTEYLGIAWNGITCAASAWWNGVPTARMQEFCESSQ